MARLWRCENWLEWLHAGRYAIGHPARDRHCCLLIFLSLTQAVVFRKDLRIRRHSDTRARRRGQRQRGGAVGRHSGLRRGVEVAQCGERTLAVLSLEPPVAQTSRLLGVGRGLSASPSLRTGLADLPHPALQLVVLFAIDS